MGQVQRHRHSSQSTDIDMALNYLQCCCVWKGSLARLSTDSGGSFFFKGQENIFVL